MSLRILSQVVRGRQTTDGAGVRLRRVLGPSTIAAFDPFLMLDGFDSTDPADYVAGFPWHPHRGIETVTYLIEGDIEHGDSLGNSGSIRDGQCQWMTAGSGIIHQEMPKTSGRMLGCQLWVNLAAAEKMCRPTYRDIAAADRAEVREADAVIRVISGEYAGRGGAFRGDHVRVQYLDVDLAPGKDWRYSQTPNDETLFLYLVEGSLAADAGLEHFEEKACALLLAASSEAGAANDEVLVRAGPSGARFLLVAGRPLKEPVAWGGPIVMNTQKELDQAFSELEAGAFIREGAAEASPG